MKLSVRFALLVLLLPAAGCLHAGRMSVIVPNRCIQISVRSFTRPCSQLADGKLLCNGVLVSASCVQRQPKVADK